VISMLSKNGVIRTYLQVGTMALVGGFVCLLYFMNFNQYNVNVLEHIKIVWFSMIIDEPQDHMIGTIEHDKITLWFYPRGVNRTTRVLIWYTC
jgi:hypothetical protein